MLSAGGAALALRSGGVEQISPADDTLGSLAAPTEEDNDPGDLSTGVDLELDESLAQGGAPLLAEDEQPAAAPPNKASTGKRRSARRVARAHEDPSTPPPVDGIKWMLWGALPPTSAPPADVLDAPVAPPAVGGKPRARAMAEATYVERKRAMERIGGVPPMVIDMAASGGVPIYRPEGGPEGVGVVVKPRWGGVVLGAVFE
jgi:hypothetical protein